MLNLQEVIQEIQLRSFTKEATLNIFSIVNKTAFYWKMMSSKTFRATEKLVPGFTASKDRPTLLLGVRTAGDFKLKTVLICYFENPRALKTCPKATLEVLL